MQRRTYLGAAALAAGASVGGCAGLSGESTLGSPEEERDDGRIRFVYDHGGDRVAAVQISLMSARPGARSLYAGVEPMADVSLDEFRFWFDPDAPEFSGVKTLVRPPENGWYDEYDVVRREDGAVIEVNDVVRNFGVVGWELLVRRESGDEIPPLRVEYDVGLSSGGRFGETFVIEGERRIDLDRL